MFDDVYANMSIERLSWRRRSSARALERKKIHSFCQSTYKKRKEKKTNKRKTTHQACRQLVCNLRVLIMDKCWDVCKGECWLHICSRKWCSEVIIWLNAGCLAFMGWVLWCCVRSIGWTGIGDPLQLAANWRKLSHDDSATVPETLFQSLGSLPERFIFRSYLTDTSTF